MKSYHKVLGTLGSMVCIVLIALTALLSVSVTLSNADDTLYVGDGSDNSVKSFNASAGVAVKNSLAGLKGPRGIVFTPGGSLLVSDQNIGTSAPGDIILYSLGTVRFDFVIQNNQKDAPSLPDGIILTPSGVVPQGFYVADFTSETNKNKPLTPGRVRQYTNAGVFVRDLVPPLPYFDKFHPRGLVIGPDGLLYVSVYPNTNHTSPIDTFGLGGQVLMFDPSTGDFKGEFINDNNDANAVNHLNRPDGLVFGPDGNLYITSFRANADDIDTIRIYRGPLVASSGDFVDKIELDQVGQPRAFAQALLFGPLGKLFIPITGVGPDTGSVRRYDVTTKDFVTFVPAAAAGGPLGSGEFLTFGKTNPATLAYEP